MKIASFNINGVKARIGALTGWLALRNVLKTEPASVFR